MEPYTKITCKIGKSKQAKVYQGHVSARLIKDLNRYVCGSTVGAGWYVVPSHTDRIGAMCKILGYFADGRLSVGFPFGGYGVLGLEDVELISEVPERIDPTHLERIKALPRISRISERGNLIHNDGSEQVEYRENRSN